MIRLPSGRVDNIALGQRFFGDRLIVNDSYGVDEAGDVVASGRGERGVIRAPLYCQSRPGAALSRGPALAKFDPTTLYAGGAKAIAITRRRSVQPAAMIARARSRSASGSLARTSATGIGGELSWSRCRGAVVCYPAAGCDRRP